MVRKRNIHRADSGIDEQSGRVLNVPELITTPSHAGNDGGIFVIKSDGLSEG
jgi:hypothetical protein